MKLRIFISGQKAFGLGVFNLVNECGHEVSGVSAPDGDALYAEALKAGVEASHSGRTLPGSRVAKDTDLIVCAHSFEFISADARRRSKYGGVGYHPSLLPLLKGRHAVEEAAALAPCVTGGSIYVLGDGWDDGAVLYQDTAHVPAGITARGLWVNTLAPLGLRLYAMLFTDLAAYGPTWDAAYARCVTASPDWDCHE